jgi:predicted RNase H-like nuclease
MGDMFIGIDGCRGGWLYAAIRGRAIIEIVFSESLPSICERLPNATLFLVDIPIGLTQKQPRVCDVNARQFLKPQSGSCVFPPPCRQALRANSYPEASAVNQAVTGKKISRQTWRILPKIREVDDFLRTSPPSRKILRESHPEVCFRAFTKKPLGFSKKTPEGILERLAILNPYLVDIERWVLQSFVRHRRIGVAIDDILDALVLAVTAGFACDNPKTLPHNPPKDDAGQPMEIVYALPPEKAE